VARRSCTTRCRDRPRSSTSSRQRDSTRPNSRRRFVVQCRILGRDVFQLVNGGGGAGIRTARMGDPAADALPEDGGGAAARRGGTGRTEAPPVTEPPLAKLHGIVPVAASRAYMLVPALASDPAYMTPLATVTNEVSMSPCGSGVCQATVPVAGSTSQYTPLFWPMPSSCQVRPVTGSRMVNRFARRRSRSPARWLGYRPQVGVQRVVHPGHSAITEPEGQDRVQVVIAAGWVHPVCPGAVQIPAGTL
jgi:hypothetical protein